MLLAVGSSRVLAATTSAGSAPAVNVSRAAVKVSGATIPFSSFASPQAERAFRSLRGSLAKQPPPEPGADNDVETVRRTQNEETDRILAEVNRRYRASIRTEILGGVKTDIVTPEAG